MNIGSFFVADSKATKLIQPGKGSFHYPSRAPSPIGVVLAPRLGYLELADAAMDATNAEIVLGELERRLTVLKELLFGTRGSEVQIVAFPRCHKRCQFSANRAHPIPFQIPLSDCK